VQYDTVKISLHQGDVSSGTTEQNGDEVVMGQERFPGASLVPKTCRSRAISFGLSQGKGLAGALHLDVQSKDFALGILKKE
jgi:hypothetical protein